MTFPQFISILRARWVSALGVLLAVVMATTAISLLLPKQYTATASMLIDIRSPDPLSATGMPSMVTPGYMATQADLIQSEKVARRAMSALRLGENADLRADWMEDTKGQGDFEAWLALALAKKLEIKPARESNVLTVSYTSRDPKFSAAMANAYVKGYVDTTLELKVEPARQYSAFFEERARKFREDVEVAQNKLSEYQRAKGIVVNDERLDVENLRLAELSSQVVTMEAVVAETMSRQAQASSTPDRMQEVLNNPVVSGLQADLSRQEAKLEEMTSRLGEANPQVIEARSSIAVIRNRMQAATQRASGSVGISNSAAQQRLAAVRSARDEQRAKILKMKGGRDELAVLQREVESAQRTYDSMLARANQTSMESRNTQTNVSVVKDATPPSDPASPRLMLNVVLAFVLGSLLAVVTALVRELRDPRLRTPEDVRLGLKQHLLLVMPKPVSAADRALKHEQQVRQRVGGGSLTALPR